MTTIATDGLTIAADGLELNGWDVITKTCQKIRLFNGTIYALTGGCAVFDAVIAWHQAGAAPNDAPKPSATGWTLIVIDNDGFGLLSNETPYRRGHPYPAAFGSGADFALAAMRCGKSPKEAVELAAELSVSTGGDIMVVDIKAIRGWHEAAA